MFVRIDDLYINLDNATRIEVNAEAEEVVISFGAGTFYDGNAGAPCAECLTLYGKQGARLLKWLDAGGRVSEA
jgi:hypothetical protein